MMVARRLRMVAKSTRWPLRQLGHACLGQRAQVRGRSRHSAVSSILGLPSVKVHERSKGLAKNRERNPKDGVAKNTSMLTHLHLHWCGESYQGQLEEHS